MIDINKEYEGLTWEDCIGSEAAVLLKAWGDSIPQVVLFSGPYGCGKNLHAYLLAKELGNVEVHVRNTVDNTAKGATDLIMQFSAPPLVPTVKQVCILNEFTLFRKDAQAKFKDIFQAPPERTYFFVCTNEPEKIIADVYNRFRVRFHVDELDQEDSYELVERTCKRLGVEISKKKKLMIARGSKGIPRTIVYTINAILDAKTNTEEFIQSYLRKQAVEEQNSALIELWLYATGKKYFKGKPADVRNLIEESGDADSIRYTMLHMLYKGYHHGCGALFHVLLPPLTKGAEKQDLFFRFLKLFKLT